MSLMEEFAEQIGNIVMDGPFSEEAVLSVDGYLDRSVGGIFFSGSYEEGNMAPYSMKNLVDREFFQVSALQLSDIDRPWDALRGATLALRGREFRISAVSGKRGSVLTLELQEADDDGE